MPAAIRTESTYDLPFSRRQLWPILSKTDWINRSLGLPPVNYEIKPLPEGGTTVIAQARKFGITLRWQENPFEWVEEDYYHVQRIFEGGLLAEARLGMVFRPGENSGTRVLVFAELTPRNAFGAGLARFVLGPKADHDVGKIIHHVSEFLNGQKQIVMPKLPTQPVNESSLQAGLKKLRETGQPADLIRRLEEMLRASPDVELSHIRPFSVARGWGCDRWPVLRLFLHATNCGLLNFSWEVLCPNCRSSRQPATTSLSSLRQSVHCEVCQISYDGQFDKSVELKFKVSPAVRPNEAQTFCLAGPGGKPHIVSQLMLAPGQRRAWKLPALTVSHRLRSPQVKRPVTFAPEDVKTPLHPPLILCQPDEFQVVTELGGTNDPAVQVMNPNNYPIQLTLERIEWEEDILTAARVTNWQEFRDLFAKEVISPNEQVTVGSQIVLFTDLRGSTAMYCGLGDAPAYSLVRDHFRILEEAIRPNHGTIVKTVGDAVMAVFSQVDEALSAVRDMHRSLQCLNSGEAGAPVLTLKSGLHVGSCLAVNANDKLDYFGTTVNLAARMVDCCRGGDVTVSDELFRRAETVEFLKQSNVAVESAEVKFRGFDNPIKVWRIPMVL